MASASEDMSDSTTDAQVSLKTLVSLALPALFVLIATPLYLLVDTALVGRLGTTQLAALAVGTLILGQVSTQLTFLSYGTTTRSSHAFGAGRKSDAIYEGVQATWVALAVGGALTALIALCAPWLTRVLSGGSSEVADLALSWLHIGMFAIIPILITMAGNGWLRGIANTRLPFYFTLCGAIPAVLFVPFAISHWGLIGSALSTLTGVSLTAILFIGCLVYYWHKYGDHRSLWPQWSVIKKQLVLGRDFILRSLSFQIAFVSATAVAARFGNVALASHQVLLQLLTFVSLTLDALAIAAQSLVGAAVGARRFGAARAMSYTILLGSAILAAGLAILLVILKDPLIGLFTHDPAVTDQIGAVWWILIATVIMGSVAFAFDGILMGASDIVYLRNTTLIAMLGGLALFSWLSLRFDWGLTGIWYGMLFSMTLRAVFVSVRFASGAWITHAQKQESVQSRGKS